MSEQKPSDWSSRAGDVLSTITDRWVVAGALAAIQYRIAERATTDADILVEWRPDLVPTLEAAGYELTKIVDPQVGHPHLLIARRGEEHVDFLIPTVEYQELALERGQPLHRLTVEDVIIHKLLASRPRDLDDVASILAAGHALDLDYIEHWAAFWEITDRWRQATGAR